MSSNPCVAHVSQFQLSKQIYTIFDKVELKNTTKLVLIALVDHYNPKNKAMFPSQKTIADKVKMSEKSVNRAIQELTEKGLIVYITKKVNFYNFTSIFFGMLNLSVKKGQEVCGKTDRMSDKHIKEQKKNRGDFKNSKKSNTHDLSNTFKESYQKAEGTKYKSVETTKQEALDNKKNVASPMELSKEKAVEFLENLPKELQGSYFARELRKKWALTMKDYQCRVSLA